MKSNLIGLAMVLILQLFFKSDCVAQGDNDPVVAQYLGTYKGTIKRSANMSSTFFSTPVTVRLHGIQNGQKKMSISVMRAGNIKREVVYGVADENNLVWSTTDGDNKKCFYVIALKLSRLNGNTYLSGSSGWAAEGCYSSAFDLKKLDSDTSALVTGVPATNVVKEKTETKAGAIVKLSVGTYRLSDTIKGLDQVMQFNFVISQARAQQAKFAYSSSGGPCDVKFEGLLKKANGAVYSYSSSDQKTSFTLSPGKSAVKVTRIKCDESDECAFCPADGLYAYKGAESPATTVNPNAQNFSNTKSFTTKTGKVVNVSRIGSGGGATPDELGRLLLRSLQTNDLALWMSCMHLGSVAVTQEFNAQRFQQFRDWLAQDGVSDWNAVRFNRVTYHTSKAGGNEGASGEKTIQNFIIEFDYKGDEFLGAMGTMSLETVRSGKGYLVWFPGMDTALKRKPRR